jgi:uncharacterized protein Yka (UPF0111/DUF47 family)
MATKLNWPRVVATANPPLDKVATYATRLGEITEAVTILKGRSDELHDEDLKDLFRRHEKTDLMSYLIGNETPGQLEKVIDRFEDMTNEISGIVIRNV